MKICPNCGKENFDKPFCTNCGHDISDVETEEERQLLKDMGCDWYQGYLFGKPLPLEDFIKNLKENRK